MPEHHVIQKKSTANKLGKWQSKKIFEKKQDALEYSRR